MSSSQTSLAVQCRQHGKPQEVLEVVRLVVEPPQKQEVQVRLLAAPINPADLNVLEGTYGRLPRLPSTPGTEGVGVVVAVGREVSTLIGHGVGKATRREDYQPRAAGRKRG